MRTDPSNVPVKSVERTLDLIKIIQEQDGATVTQLAEDLDAAKSTVHNHLRTLKRRGYITKIDDRFYVGLRFLDHGGYARERDPGYQHARSKVKELANETGELCSCIVEQEGKGVIVYQEQGHKAVKTQSRVGRFGYLHAIPGGKAILAAFDSETVDQIIDRYGLPPITPDTITDSESLRVELDTIAERGYAINAEEYLQSLHAISVPIRFANGDVYGAITIVGPAHRFSNAAVEETMADQLLGVSNELELNLTYSRH